MYLEQFNKLVLLSHKETITYKTVTLYKKLYFFHENSKWQENEGGTNFALLNQSRNMVGQLNKIYLQLINLLRPIKILQFLTRARIKRYVT